MDSRGGAPGEVLKRLLVPAMAAAFRAKGWYVQLIIEDAETMHEIILEQAEEQHKNDQKQKGTKERFDPSVFEPLPEGSRYVTEISIAPPWLRAAYSKLAPVSMSDFAHCKPTRTSMFGGITGGKIFQGGNMEVVDGVYTRWFGNEDEYAWLGLNQATDEALPEYDHQGQTDIIDGDKGGRKANECRKVGLFMDYHHRLETVKANCGATAGQLYTMAFNRLELSESLVNKTINSITIHSP
mmetsp:Transcript_16338/g.49195  ORF Transcript_16338/g.49195 Transcript_16338/m.49195 type:complete len:240 (+) Transcript_16338:168-887(+)